MTNAYNATQKYQTQSLINGIMMRKMRKRKSNPIKNKPSEENSKTSPNWG